MKNASKSIANQALGLPPLERAKLADQLLSSLEQTDKSMDDLWAAEAEARIDAYERGEIEVVSVVGAS